MTTLILDIFSGIYANLDLCTDSRRFSHVFSLQLGVVGFSSLASIFRPSPMNLVSDNRHK